MKIKLPKQLRTWLSALVGTGLTLGTGVSNAEIMSYVVSMQVYMDMASNFGIYKPGATTVAIPYTVDGKDDFILFQMPDFRSMADSGAFALVTPNLVATVNHNGMFNGTFAARYVGANALSYSTVGVRNDNLFIWNNTAGDFKVDRTSRLVTDTVAAPVCTDKTILSSLTGRILYRAGGGTMQLQLEDGTTIPVKGAYSMLAAGISYIGASSYDPITGFLAYTTPRLLEAKDLTDKNILPFYLQGGDSGSPSFIWNENSGQFEYLGAGQAIGGPSYYKGNNDYVVALEDAITVKAQLTSSLTTVTWSAATQVGVTNAAMTTMLGLSSDTTTPPIITYSGDGTKIVSLTSAGGSANLYSGMISDGTNSFEYVGVNVAVQGATWSDLNLETATWYKYSATGMKRLTDATVFYTQDVQFTAASAAYNIIIDGKVDTGIGIVKFDRGTQAAATFTLTAANGASTLDSAGWVINNGVTVISQMTGSGDEWRAIGAGTLRIQGTGNNYIGLNVGTGLTTILERTGGYAAYNVLINTGATVGITTVGQIGNNVTFGSGGGTLNLMGNSITWASTGMKGAGANFGIAMITESDVIANYSAGTTSTINYTLTGNNTMVGSLRDNGTSSLQFIYNSAGTLTMNGYNTSITGANGGISIQQGKVVLIGTQTRHASTTSVSSYVYYDDDWQLARLTGSVQVNSGATFEVSKYSVYAGEMNVAGKAVLNNGAAVFGAVSVASGGNLQVNQLSGMTGHLTLQNNSTIEFWFDSSFGSLSSNGFNLNGGTLTVAGTSTVLIYVPSALAAGSYALVTSGNLNITGASFVIGGQFSSTGTSRQDATLEAGTGDNANTLYLKLVGNAGELTWAGTSASRWTLKGGATPWSGVADNQFYTADRVVFAAGTTSDVVIAGDVSPATVLISGGTYSFKSDSGNAGRIVGMGSLTMTGGAVTMDTDNNYGGGTVISGGTMTLGSNGTLGTGTVTLAGGTLVLNKVSQFDISKFNFTSGTLDLSAFNYAFTNLSGGGDNIVFGARTVTLYATGESYWGGKFTWSTGGSLVKSSAGTMIVGALDSKTASVTLSAGQLLVERSSEIYGISMSNNTTFGTATTSAANTVLKVGSALDLGASGTTNYYLGAVGSQGTIEFTALSSNWTSTIYVNQDVLALTYRSTTNQNVTLNVAAGATFTANSWGNHSNGSTGTIQKAGDGTLVVKALNSIGQNKGLNATAGSLIFDITTGSSSQSVAMNVLTVSAGVILEKRGAGTLVLGGASNVINTQLILREGIVSVTNANGLGLGGAVVRLEGGTLNLATGAQTLSNGLVIGTGGTIGGTTNLTLGVGSFITMTSILGTGAGTGMGSISLGAANLTLATNQAFSFVEGTNMGASFTLFTTTTGNISAYNTANFVISGLGSRQGIDWSTSTAKALIAVITNTSANLTWKGGNGIWGQGTGVGSVWDSTDPITDKSFQRYDYATIGTGADTVASGGTLWLGSNVEIGKINVTGAGNWTISTVGTEKITGAGFLLKDGSGTLTISTANDYTGGTTVQEGTLNALVSGALGGTTTSKNALDVSGGNVNVTAAQENLGGTTITGGAVSVTGAGTLGDSQNLNISGGKLTVGATGGNVNLTVGDTTVGDGATFAMRAGESVFDILNMGLFDYTGSSGIALQLSLTTSSEGAYLLMTSTDWNGVASSVFSHNLLDTPRQTYTLGYGTDVDANGLYLFVSGEVASLVWDGTSTNNIWYSKDAGTKNWKNEGTVDWFYDLDSVTFSNAAAHQNVVISGEVDPTKITVSGGTYTWTGDATGKIAGSTTSLLVSGGTLTLGVANNTYEAGTTVTGGTLNATAVNTLGTGALTIDGGTATVSATQSLSSTTLRAGTLTLSAANALGAGSITMSGGELRVAVSGALGSQALALSGGTLNFNQGGVAAHTNGITSTGGLLSFTGVGSFTHSEGIIRSGSGGISVASTANQVLIKYLEVTASQTWTVVANKILAINDTIANTATTKTITITGGGKVDIAAGGSAPNNASYLNWVVSGGSTLAFIGANPGASVTLDNGTLTGGIPSEGGLSSNYGNWTYGTGTSFAIASGGGTFSLYHNNSGLRSLTIQGTLSGTGALTFDRTGTAATNTGEEKLTLSGNIANLSGVVTVNGGNGTALFSLTVAGNTMYTGNTVLSTQYANLLFDTHGSSLAYAGDISGAGRVTVNRAGQTITLTGANSYTGITTITAGTLKLMGSGTLGTNGVTNNATLEVDRDNAFTLAQAISGTGVVRQTGTGTTTLTGANTYTGGTTVTAGVLIASIADVLGGTSTTKGNLSVQGGAANISAVQTHLGATTITGGVLSVTGAGTLGSTQALNISGGKLVVGGISSGKTLTVGNTTVGDGASIALRVGNGATTDLLNLGAFTYTGTSGILLDLTSMGLSNGGNYLLMTATNWNGVAESIFTHNLEEQTRQFYSLVFGAGGNANGLYLVVTGGVANLTWNGTATNNTWYAGGTGAQNWLSGSTSSWFNTLDNATFDATAENQAVVISGAIEATAIVVSGGAYTFSGATAADKITGASTLSISGGSLRLTSANDFSGGTIISGGQLLLQHAGAIGSGGVAVENGGKLTADGVNYAGAVVGGGATSFINALGAGAYTGDLSGGFGVANGDILALSGVTGGASFANSGTLNLNASTLGTLTMANGSVLNLTGANSIGIFTPIAGASTVTIGGGGSMSSVFANNGILQVGAGGFHVASAAASNLVNGATVKLADGAVSAGITSNCVGTTGTLAQGGGASGATYNFGDVAHVGMGGVLSIDSIQTWGAPTAPTTYNIFSDVSIGNYVSDSGGSALKTWNVGAGATLTLGNLNAAHVASYDKTGTGTMIVQGMGQQKDVAISAGAFAFDVAGTLNYGSVLSGAGAFAKLGAGTVTLSGTNTYTGGTTLSAGTVKLSGVGTAGTGAITFNGGALALDTGIISLSNELIINAGVTGVFGATTLATSSGMISYLGTDNVTFGGLTFANVSVATNQVFHFDSSIVSGTYTLATGLGNSDGDTSLFSVSGISARRVGVWNLTGGTLTLTLNATGSVNLTWAGVTNNVWQDTNVALAANWVGATEGFLNGDFVTFGTTGAGAVSIVGEVAPGTITVTAGIYTFNGATAADKITGTGATLAVNGGSLTLSSANDFGGGTIVGAGGTLIVSAANAVGTGGVIVNGGTLTTTIANALGAGGVTLNSGTLTANVLNALGTGVLTVNDGRAVISAAQGVSSVVIGATGTVEITGAAVLGTGAIISGSGTLVFNIGATISHGSAMRLEGMTGGALHIQSGRLSAGNISTYYAVSTIKVTDGGHFYAGGTWAQNWELAGKGWTGNDVATAGAVRWDGATITGTVNLTANAWIGVYSGSSTITGQVTATTAGTTFSKTMTGTLVLNGALSANISTLELLATRAGNNTMLSAGTLTFASGTLANVQTIRFALDTAVTGAHTGTLQWATSNTNTLAADMFIGSGFTATLDSNGNNIGISGSITGAGSLALVGLGTTTISGSANNLTGTLLVSAGTLAIQSANSTFGNLTLHGTATTTASFGVSDGSVAVAASVTGTLRVGTGTLSFYGGSTITGITTFLASEGAGGRTSIINQHAGSTVNVTGATNSDTTSNSFLLAHWNGGATYNMLGGTLNVQNTRLALAWDGQGTLNQSGGTINTLGLRLRISSGSANGAGTYNLSGGVLNLGADGISTANATRTTANLGAGMLGAYANWSSSVAMQLGYFSGGQIAGTVVSPIYTTINTTDSVDGFTGRTIILSGILSNFAGSVGGLTVTGAGTLVLSAANTYSGGTTLHGGTLSITGTGTAGTGAVTFNGGTLALGSGISAFTNALVVNAGVATSGFTAVTAATSTGLVSYLGASNLGIIAMSNVSFAANQTFLFDVSLSAGTHTLATGVGNLSTDAFIISGVAVRRIGAWDLTSGTLSLTIKNTSAANLLWAGGYNNVWKNNDATLADNWSGVGYEEGFLNGDFVTFDASSGAGLISLVGAVAPGSITVEGGEYTFHGDTAADKITGATTLSVTGGELTLSSANDFTGGTTVTGGRLSATAVNVLGTGTLTVNGGAVVVSENQNVGAVVLGFAGEVVITKEGVLGDGSKFSGVGTLTLDLGTVVSHAALNLSNMLGGTLYMQSGRLEAGNTPANYKMDTIMVADGAQVYTSGGAWSQSWELIGTGWGGGTGATSVGAVRWDATTINGLINLAGNAWIGVNSGTTTINGLVLATHEGTTLSKTLGGTLVLGASAIVDDNITTLELLATRANDGTQAGAGTLTFARGTLDMIQNIQFSVGAGATTRTGTLQWAAGNTDILTVAVSIGAGFTATLNNGGNSVGISGSITGAGSLVLAGTGITTLSGSTNSLTGAINVSAGTLSLQSANFTLGNFFINGSATATTVANFGVLGGGVHVSVNVGTSFGVGVGTVNIYGGATINNILTFRGSEGAASRTSILNQHAGSTVNMVGSIIADGNTNSFILAHYSGSGTYNMLGGTLNVQNTRLGLGLDGQGTLNQSGGTINTLGLRLRLNGGGSGAGTYNLSGGVLNLGADGIGTNTVLRSTVNLGAGTVGAYANWSSSLDMKLGYFAGTQSAGTVGSPIYTTINTTDSVNGTTGRTITMSGILSNFASSVGGLMVTGSGTLVLSGTNTYTGGTIVQSGNLNATAVNALGVGSLTIYGGKVTLRASQTSVTATTVQGGSLVIDGTLTLANNLSVTSTGTVSLGSTAGEGNVLTVGSLSLYVGATLEMRAGTLGTDSITMGSFNWLGGTTDRAVLYIHANSAFVESVSYLLLTSTNGWGTWTDDADLAAHFSLAGDATDDDTTRQNFSLKFGTADAADAQNVYLIVTGDPATLTWAATNNGIWQELDNEGNWIADDEELIDTRFHKNDFVIFTTAGAGAVTIDGDVSPGSITVESGDYVFSSSPDGSGRIVGLGTSLTMNGGNVTLNMANIYGGGTMLNGGTLTLGAEGAIGSGAITFSGGVLKYGTGITTDISGSISATGLTASNRVNIDLNGNTVAWGSDVNWLNLTTADGAATLNYNGSTTGRNFAIGAGVTVSATVYNGSATVADNSVANAVTLSGAGKLIAANTDNNIFLIGSLAGFTGSIDRAQTNAGGSAVVMFTASNTNNDRFDLYTGTNNAVTQAIIIGNDNGGFATNSTLFLRNLTGDSNITTSYGANTNRGLNIEMTLDCVFNGSFHSASGSRWGAVTFGSAAGLTKTFTWTGQSLAAATYGTLGTNAKMVILDRTTVNFATAASGTTGGQWFDDIEIQLGGTLLISRTDSTGFVQQTGANNTIIGAGAVKITGNATFSAANTYTGGTTLTGGVLSISAANNIGTTAGAITFGGGTLRLTATMNLGHALAVIASNAVNLSLANSATVTLSGANVNTVAMNIFGAGTVFVSNSVGTVFSSAISISAGATLQLRNSGNDNPATTISGVLSGTGKVIVESTVTGNTTRTVRNFISADNSGFTGEIVLKGNWGIAGTIFTPTSGLYYDTSFTNYKSFGSGTVTLDGQGFLFATNGASSTTAVVATLNLVGATYLNGASVNTYSFTAIKGAGSFTSALGNADLAVGTYFHGSLIGFSGSFNSIGAVGHNYNFGNGSAATVDANGNIFADQAILHSSTGSATKYIFRYTNSFVMNATVTGNAIIHKYGDGIMTVTKNNTSTGATTISAGTIRLTQDGTLGSGAITNNGILEIAKLSTDPATILAQVISGSGSLVQSGTGTTTLSGAGANTYDGGTLITDGTLIAGKVTAFGSVAKAVVLQGGTLNLGGLAIGNAINTTAGAGTRTITNAGAYTNKLTVGANTTLIGALGTSAGSANLEIASGATLSWSGTAVNGGSAMFTIKDITNNGMVYFDLQNSSYSVGEYTLLSATGNYGGSWNTSQYSWNNRYLTNGLSWVWSTNGANLILSIYQSGNNDYNQGDAKPDEDTNYNNVTGGTLVVDSGISVNITGNVIDGEVNVAGGNVQIIKQAQADLTSTITVAADATGVTAGTLKIEGAGVILGGVGEGNAIIATNNSGDAVIRISGSGASVAYAELESGWKGSEPDAVAVAGRLNAFEGNAQITVHGDAVIDGGATSESRGAIVLHAGAYIDATDAADSQVSIMGKIKGEGITANDVILGGERGGHSLGYDTTIDVGATALENINVIAKGGHVLIQNTSFDAKSSVTIHAEGGTVELGGTIGIAGKGFEMAPVSAGRGLITADEPTFGGDLDFSQVLGAVTEINDGTNIVLNFGLLGGDWSAFLQLAKDNKDTTYSLNVDLGNIDALVDIDATFSYSGIQNGYVLSFTKDAYVDTFSWDLWAEGDHTLYLTFVPEPSTATLGILGLAGLLLRRRRRA